MTTEPYWRKEKQQQTEKEEITKYRENIIRNAIMYNVEANAVRSLAAVYGIKIGEIAKEEAERIITRIREMILKDESEVIEDESKIISNLKYIASLVDDKDLVSELYRTCIDLGIYKAPMSSEYIRRILSECSNILEVNKEKE